MIKKLRYCIYENLELKANSLWALLFAFFVLLATSTQAQLHIATDIHIGDGGNLHVAVAETTFEKGIVSTSRGVDYGLMSFAAPSTWARADHNTHVDGFVRMHSDNLFSFPVGDDGILQPVQIQRIDQSSAVDMSFQNLPYTNLQAESGIDQVSEQFYWELIGDKPAYVALSWNAFSNLDKLTDNNLDRLGIVGYDGSEWRTIESEIQKENFHDNSPSSLLSGSIRSKNPINLEGYTALTLARMGDSGTGVSVSQGFTPNGDGINDTWYIEGIDRFPNARIIVYSRWEREVFSIERGYKNDWGGIYKNNNEPVPDGSYAYVIDLDGDGKMDQAGWIYITR